MQPQQLEIFPDSQALSNFACHKIINIARRAIDERGCFRIVLSGGGTPSQVYALLAETKQDWRHWEIYWGDERCLPIEDPERNSYQARHVWLNRVGIPEAQIFPIAAELGANAAADNYNTIIADKMPFDLVLLGMGEDGHTASLFPGNPAQSDNRNVVAVANAPKPPSARVSLNFSALKNTREQIILVTGSSKIKALAQWKNEGDIPIAQACIPAASLLLDAAAAEQLND